MNVASVAGPPSPEYPSAPVPAMVTMTPVSRSTRRMQWFIASAKYMLPAKSKAHMNGSLSRADAAASPSPE